MGRSIIWRRICSGKPAREPDCGRDGGFADKAIVPAVCFFTERKPHPPAGTGLPRSAGLVRPLSAESDLHAPGGCYVNQVCAVQIDGAAVGTPIDGPQELQLFYLFLAELVGRIQDRSGQRTGAVRGQIRIVLVAAGGVCVPSGNRSPTDRNLIIRRLWRVI